MNYDFILHKNKYSFSYALPMEIVNEKIISERSKQISLFLKELHLYGISLSSLYKDIPNVKEKDQLLNIAIFISSDESFLKEIKTIRRLNTSRLNKYTEFSKRYLDRWSNYIIAYFILYSNPSYNLLKSFLNIYIREKSSETALEPSKDTLEKNTGIVLKSNEKSAVILTYHGEFVNINTESAAEAGALASGNAKKSLIDYKIPIILSTVILIIAIISVMIFYNYPKSTIVVHHKNDYVITVNRLNRVNKITYSSMKNKVVLKGSKITNRKPDEALLALLSDLNKNDILKDHDKITIIVSGEPLDYNALTQSESFLKEKDIKAEINNSGRNHKIK